MRVKAKDHEKGEMGVGTLIIIISFILVAAVVANVLINSSQLVGEQSEKTYDDTLKNTGSTFFVKDSVGINTDGDNELEKINIKVGLPACSSPQNLTQTVIEIDDGNRSGSLNYSEGKATSDHYVVEVMIDPEDDFRQNSPIVNPGTIVKITINTSAVGLELTPQTELDVKIIPKHGSVKAEDMCTPSVYDSEFIELN